VDLVNMRHRVEAARVARLATVGPEGRPHVVPVCFVLLGEAVYTAVDQKRKRTTRLRRLTNIEARPDCSLLVDEYDDDWSQLWWVRLDGRARIADAGEAATAVLVLADKYPPYRADPPVGPVIAIDVEEWSGWTA
jgi:PPOX class probable F420-dependent enzyme